MTDSNSPEQEQRPNPSFKEVLVQTSFTQGRAISESVQAIDLGAFADEGRELIQTTLSDPKKREYGKLVTVTSDTKKVRIYKMVSGTSVVDNQAHVQQEQQIRVLAHVDILAPRHKRIPEMWGTLMHSHPLEVPPSSEDLYSLLLGDFDPRAESAVFVATPTKFIILFRGQNAPHLTHAQAEEKGKMWEKSMEERIKQFRTPGMSEAEQIRLNERARSQLLRQISAKYDFKIFTGDIKDNVVKLQDAPELESI